MDNAADFNLPHPPPGGAAERSSESFLLRFFQLRFNECLFLVLKNMAFGVIADEKKYIVEFAYLDSWDSVEDSGIEGRQ